MVKSKVQPHIDTKRDAWPSVRLSDLVGYNIQNGLYKPASAYGTGTPIVRINDFDNAGQFAKQELQRLVVSADELRRYSLATGDILINRVNSLTHIGKSVLISHLIEPTIFESNMMRLRLDAETLIPQFFAYVLQTLPVREFFKKRAKKAVAQASINQGDIEDLEFLLPPLPEQRKIAEILGTWDAAIARGEQLIAALQLRKKGLMQRLLTGQVRFPEFANQSWRYVSIGEISVKFVNGGTPSTSKQEYWNGNIPWITGADVVNQRVATVRSYVTPEGVKNSATNVVAKGNLLVVTRTGVGKLAVAPCDIAISQDLTGIYLDARQVDTHFLFHYLDYHSSALARLTQGTSINGITRDTLDSFKLTIPNSLGEQARIAEVLNLADAELSCHKQKLTALRQQKKGLMQRLLAGQVRVRGYGDEVDSYRGM